MGSIVDQMEGSEPAHANPVRCPVCGRDNVPMQYCRHVRWTFDQGDPIDFTKFALETSPYTRNRGADVRNIPQLWWNEHADWVIDLVLLHFAASEGYVFGELCDLDLLARDIWREFAPEAPRAQLQRH